MTNFIKTIIIALISITSITTSASAGILTKIANGDLPSIFNEDYAIDYTVECQGRGWFTKDIYEITSVGHVYKSNGEEAHVSSTVKYGKRFNHESVFSGEDHLFFYAEDTHTVLQKKKAGWHIEITDVKWSSAKGEYEEIVLSAYCKETNYKFTNY